MNSKRSTLILVGLPAARLGFEDVPTATTVWNADASATLTENTPVTLSWDNGKGLVFTRVISIDENFMFNVEQSATNTADACRAPRPLQRAHAAWNSHNA
jgi:YidC/Oxa1 family membrane protein insertase